MENAEERKSGVNFEKKILVVYMGPTSFEVSLSKIDSAVRDGKKGVMIKVVAEEEGNLEEGDGIQREDKVDNFTLQCSSEAEAKDLQSCIQVMISKQALLSFGKLYVETLSQKKIIEVWPSHILFKGVFGEMRLKYEDLSDILLLKEPIAEHGYRYIVMISRGHDHHYIVRVDTSDWMEKHLGSFAYKFQLKDNYLGYTYEVFCDMVTSLTGLKLTENSSFRGSKRCPAVECVYSNKQGYLYPFETCFYFLPGLIINLSEVQSVVIQSFDDAYTLVIRCNKTENEENFFSGIDSSEYEHLLEYLRNHNLNVDQMKKEEVDFHQLIGQ